MIIIKKDHISGLVHESECN